MKITILSLVVVVGLTACTSTAPYSATRSAETGKVVISYQLDTIESPQLTLKQGNRIATRNCQSIGYSYTERDVHVWQQCSAVNSSGDCSLWQVAKRYQCAGNKVAQPQSHAVVWHVPPPSRP